MSGDSDGHKITKFDGRNFGLWKKHVKIILQTKQLEATLIKPSTTEQELKFTPQQDNMALAILLSSMNESVMLKVISCKTTADTWERLHQIYENTSPASVGKIFEQYYSYKKDPKDDMATHISKVESLAMQLEEVKEKQSEVSIMSKLLHSLPSSYEALKVAWDSVHPSLQTRGNLTARMLTHGENLDAATTSESKDVALVMRPSDGQSGNRDKGDKKKRVKCYNCGKMGHYKRDCRSKPQGNSERTGTNIALVLKNGEKSDKWVVDSGSSRHTCCRRDWFSTFEECREKLQVGNEEWVEAVGKGTIRIMCEASDYSEFIELQDVLYIPAMSFNLFSTGRAADRGAVTTLNKKGCEVHLDGRLIARGKIDSETGLCMLQTHTQPGIIMLVSTRRTVDDWHRSLGHVDPRVISEMVANASVDGMELVQKEGVSCPTCPEGKATRASHTMARSFEPKEVGDQVDIDLVGPMPVESLGKARYLLVAIDRFSKYSWATPIKTKDEVCVKLQWYIGEFEASSGKRIKSVLTDNGSEFNNAAVKTLMAVEHIQMRFASAYTPEQNGAAERNNRVIMETVRTMLAHSGLPQSVWAEAANAAAYLRNRVPRRGSKATPYELFHGRKPFVGHLVPFGTPVQSLINDRRISKLDPKTEPAFVVGFTDRANTYRIYLPKSKQVRQSCDVIFRGHADYQSEQVQNTNDPPCNTVNLGISGIPQKRAIDTFFEELNDQVNDQRSEEQGPVEQRADEATAPNNEESDIDSPSFSTLTNLSQRMSTGPEQSTPQVGQENSENVAPPTPPRISYPDISRERVLSPFQGSTIPRTPPKGRDNRPIILLSHERPGQSAPEPKTFEEAVSGPNKQSWLMAIKSEIMAHIKNKTWTIVKRPLSGTTLSAKWLFKHKRDSKGGIERYKARLVARGFEQVEGVNYGETFAPVARMDSIRVLLAIASAKGLAMERFDVSTAFLNGTVDEEIYVEPPEGIEAKPEECLKLNKALYGLKQAPKVWNSHFDRVIQQLGFRPTRSDPCVYFDEKNRRYLTIYVDDGLAIAPSKQLCLDVIIKLNQSFETKRVTGDTFLGIKLTKVGTGLHLSQSRYIGDMLEKFNMQDCSSVTVPIADSKILFDQTDQDEINVPYRAAIGSLLYAAMATRPDILYATTLLSRFNESPRKMHWAASKRVMRYLKETADVGLMFPGPKDQITISAFSDADWAGDLSGRKSTTGVIVQICGSTVIYASRQQSAVAQSSTEAEFVAACEATKEICWLVTFLSELKISHSKPTLFIDNKSAISLIKNHDVKRRTKHIEIKYHLIRQKYQEGWFALEHIGTKEQIADCLTKPLGAGQLKEIRERANIVGTSKSSFVSGRDRGGVLRHAISPE